MKKNLEEKIESAKLSDIKRWMSWILSIAAGLLVGAYGFYWAGLGSGSLSSDPAVWGQFGDFIGGTLNPIFAFLTLFSLLLTIIIQTKQLKVSSNELELSRRELELTREELRRSAHAQEMSERALAAQAKAADQSAKLSAINYLLEHYKSQLSILSQNAYRANDPRSEQLKNLREKELVLGRMLDDLFYEVINDERKNEIQSG